MNSEIEQLRKRNCTFFFSDASSHLRHWNRTRVKPLEGKRKGADINLSKVHSRLLGSFQYMRQLNEVIWHFTF